MGVDLVGIIGHAMSKKEIVNLPYEVNQWHAVNEFFTTYSNRPIEKAKWNGIINEDQLELIWQYYEERHNTKEILAKMQNFDTSIDCCFGSLSIYRQTILIEHWNHKYSNLMVPEIAKNILTLNRIIAKCFNQNEIIYCVDSGYPTQSIFHKALSGSHFTELKKYGIDKFGNPPKDIDDGRKFMFFIDDFTKDLNQLTYWGDENPYWLYDIKTNEYKLKNMH